MALPLTTVLNVNSGLANAAMAPIPAAAAGGGLSGLFSGASGLLGGVGSFLNPIAGAAGLVGGSGMFGGSDYESSSATASGHLSSGAFNVSTGGKDTNWIFAGIIALLLIVMFKKGR